MQDELKALETAIDRVETEITKRFNQPTNASLNPYRDMVLEEVAQEIEKMKGFGKDTLSSFGIFIRGMKR